jgi:predicted AAA+ superfamily ATPase
LLRETSYWENIVLKLDSLLIYKKIADDRVLTSFRRLCLMLAVEADVRDSHRGLYEFLSLLASRAEELSLMGEIFRKYLHYLYLTDVNAFSMACESRTLTSSASIAKLALKDVQILKFLSEVDIANIIESFGDDEEIESYWPAQIKENPYLDRIMEAGAAEAKLSMLQWYYELIGCGDFAEHKMYGVDDSGEIYAIRESDPVVFSDLIGCEYQKELLRSNTEAFLAKMQANNMLLTGSRGTGKSSCIKALVNQYHDRGLRLIEMDKEQAHLMPKVLEQLKGRGKSFIIFIDDLSFDDYEVKFKYLKKIMEGGAAVKPQNVLFCATSNRRHIIQEKWSDREGDELHAMDSMNEKLSLSDRFGLSITFPKPNPQEYTGIVVELARRMGIDIPEDELRKKALEWELSQKEMSGRSARQFIARLAWEMKNLHV